MSRIPRTKSSCLWAALFLVAICAGPGPRPASAQEPSDAAAAANGQNPPPELSRAQRKTASKPAQKGQYYVDFRARTAASYGHAFVWYGRVGDREVEVAGLHPATESIVPYIVGHLIPVPSETGASYGDLDEEYVTANYRLFMSEPEARRVFAYIKHLQESSPLWHAPVYNCVAFIRDIAQYMGLKTPGSHLLYPEDWVNELRQLNGARRNLDANARSQPENARAAAPSPGRGGSRTAQAKATSPANAGPRSAHARVPEADKEDRTVVTSPPQSIY